MNDKFPRKFFIFWLVVIVAALACALDFIYSEADAKTPEMVIRTHDDPGFSVDSGIENGIPYRGPRKVWR